MAESSTPEEMLSSDESSGELRADIPDHNLILYVTGARVLRVEFTNCQSWPHETSWICLPTLNLSLNKEFCPQLGVLKERWESRGEHLTSIHSGSLTFVFGHDTEFKAIQMVARHSEIKKAILLFLHKIGSQVEDISMKAVVQKAKRTAKGTAKRRHKESDQIITGMDGDSKAIHSNVCGAQIVHEMHQGSGPHSSGYTSSHQSKDMSGSESVPFVPLTTQESDPHASSDPSQGHSQTERGPRLSTASHATRSQADRHLYWASYVGDLEEVKRLLSTPGVDVDCRVGGENLTPVMAAAHWGHKDVVELLVSAGADVSLVDVDGSNILHIACMGGDMETVKYVLSLSVVDIDARNMWGETAADRARVWGYQRVVELLKSRGAQ